MDLIKQGSQVAQGSQFSLSENPTLKLRQVPELSFKSYTEGTVTQQAMFSELFYSGLKDYGFVILKDHPIPIELLKKAYAAAETFFALPTEKKSACISKSGGGQRGYTPFGKEHAKNANVPDLKEFWHVGRELPEDHPFAKDYPPNIWPAEIPEFQAVFSEMYAQLDHVGRLMLQALTAPLGLDSRFFDELTRDGNSILRLLHYPPIPESADPRCIRAAAHEDINLITILVSASASGLELLDRDGKWLAIETDPNNLIVDSGDMLARICNDVIPATTHRVVNPENSKTSRYSMPFFMHPNPQAVLSCLPTFRHLGPKYPDIRSQDFLFQRLKEIGLT